MRRALGERGPPDEVTAWVDIDQLPR